MLRFTAVARADARDKDRKTITSNIYLSRREWNEPWNVSKREKKVKSMARIVTRKVCDYKDSWCMHTSARAHLHTLLPRSLFRTARTHATPRRILDDVDDCGHSTSNTMLGSLAPSPPHWPSPPQARLLMSKHKYTSIHITQTRRGIIRYKLILERGATRARWVEERGESSERTQKHTHNTHVTHAHTHGVCTFKLCHLDG